MRRLFILAFVVGLVMFAHRPTRASVIVAIVDEVGDVDSVSVAPGQAFNVIVKVNTDVNLSALQFRLQTLDAGDGFGTFSLNSIAFNTPPWSNDSNDQVDPTVDTISSGDQTSGIFGDMATDLVNGTGTGTFNFGTINITLSALSTAPAEYRLNLTDILYGDMAFNEFAGTAGDFYTVEVIPAPGAALLGVIGLGAVGWYRKRYGMNGKRPALAMDVKSAHAEVG